VEGHHEPMEEKKQSMVLEKKASASWLRFCGCWRIFNGAPGGSLSKQAQNSHEDSQLASSQSSHCS
jgi:hypothetical protein